MTVSVSFACHQWSLSTENLTLTLSIDGREWTECFLNKRGLMTDFDWNHTCSGRMSGNCGKNNKWGCSQGTCKHSGYDLWVYSDFGIHYVNVTFTCKLPYLSGGRHTLTTIVKIYGSEISLNPQTISFRVVETDGKGLLKIFLLPLKFLRSLLPF